MNAPQLRVAVLSELPTPYRWPLFERIARLPELDVTVLFYARTESDRDWGLAIDESPDARPRVEFLPGRAFHVRGRRSLYFHWNPGIRARLSEGDFDVVVAPGWSMPSTLAAIRLCRRRRIPYVIFSESNELAPRAGWWRATKRVALRPLVSGAAAWLSTGTLSARYLERHGAAPERIFRFANTPDVDALRESIDAARPRREATRAALGVPPGAVMGLFVGRLIGAKDPLRLVESQALLERDGDAPWTVLVGDGTEREAVAERVKELGVEQLVLAGARRPEDLPATWAAADLFVLPSVHEPWGVVVNEAMAAGLPIVLSDRVGAAPDLLVDGENGRVFPAGDETALAAAIADVVRDPDRRAAMGAASAQRVLAWRYESSVQGFSDAVHAAAKRAR